jgi:hypothetical protein
MENNAFSLYGISVVLYFAYKMYKNKRLELEIFGKYQINPKANDSRIKFKTVASESDKAIIKKSNINLFLFPFKVGIITFIIMGTYAWLKFQFYSA